MAKKLDRCSGHCCENFSLPLSPAELEASYYAWLGREQGSSYVGMNGRESPRVCQDIHLIYPMLVYLGYTDKRPPKINPSDEKLLGKPEVKLHRYRCKHLDPKTRDCTIYEIRPVMCRTYPDGRTCNFAGCTWSKYRAEPHTKAELAERRRELRKRSEPEPELIKPKRKPKPKP